MKVTFYEAEVKYVISAKKTIPSGDEGNTKTKKIAAMNRKGHRPLIPQSGAG